MLKSFFRFITIIGLVAVVSAVWLRSQFYGNAVVAPFEIVVGSEVIDSDFDEFVDRAIAPNINKKMAFNFYAKYLKLSETIKPGRYQIGAESSVMRIVRILKLGEQRPVNVTFNNVRTMAELSGRVALQLDVDSLALLDYLRQESVAQKYGFNPTTLFAMFIPNTYELYWSTTPEKFTERMASEYKKFWNADRVAKAKAANLSQTEVMTLASIVYEETKKQDEMARVAGVYLNRLKIGMPLQADPTVKYAVGDFTIKRVLHKHLEVDSPYNTYKYRGLPPSPIAMPSIAAIDAVLNAEEHSYLYFCARPTFDGYHSFAKTLSEHNRNAQAYINELNRLKIK